MSDYFDRLESELRGAVARGARGAIPQRRGLPTPTIGRLATSIAAGAAIAIAVVAIAVVGRDRAHENPAAAPGARELVAELAVLRRPQTGAERAFTPPPSRFARHGRVSQRPNDIAPSLTRLARTLPDGKQIFLTVFLTSERRGRPATTRAAGVATFVVLPRTRTIVFGNLEGATSLARGSQPAPGAAASQPAPGPASAGHLILAVVPDGVARVEWLFPRIDLLGHVYPARKLTARVEGNVAAAPATPRFGGGDNASKATWLASDGRIIKTSSYETFIPVPNNQTGKPAPETPLSRRAERDPSTPNPISIIPSTGSPTTNSFNVYFRQLLNNRAYGTRVTGGPHPGCAPDYAGDIITGGSGTTLRGDLMQFPIQGQSAEWCRGTYRVTVSVLDNNRRPYPPFAATTFTVR
jgi:hypothetical protein